MTDLIVFEGGVNAEVINSYTSDKLRQKTIQSYGNISKSRFYEWLKFAEIDTDKRFYDDEDLEKILVFASLMKRYRYVNRAAKELSKIYLKETKNEQQQGFQPPKQSTNQHTGQYNANQPKSGYTITI